MIITKLQGGLGNQLFQYAAGLQLSEKLHTPLKLDLTDYEKQDNIRSYRLDAFCIHATVASREEVIDFELRHRKFISKKGYRFIKKYIPLRYFPIINEPHFHFSPTINKLNDNHLLIGYWQTEKYFENVIPKLREQLTLKNTWSAQAQQHASKMSEVNAVSVHIRRGDYVSIPKFAERFGTCTPEYYQQATAHMLAQLSNPHFFVFSDDLAWVKAHPELFNGCKNVTYIEDTAADYEDLVLMSTCKHHILANSSFSWWGAWLNASNQKVITAPKVWFAGLPYNTKDLIPENWIRL